MRPRMVTTDRRLRMVTIRKSRHQAAVKTIRLSLKISDKCPLVTETSMTLRVAVTAICMRFMAKNVSIIVTSVIVHIALRSCLSIAVVMGLSQRQPRPFFALVSGKVSFLEYYGCRG